MTPARSLWSRAASWLGAGCAEASGVGDLLLPVFGLWICHTVESEVDTKAALDDAIGRVNAGLERTSGAVDAAQVDLKLMFLVCGIMSANGAPLHDGLVATLRECAAALSRFDVVPECYAESALLLQQLGYRTGSGCTEPDVRECLRAPYLGVLHGTPAELRQLCSAVAAVSRFGGVPVPGVGRPAANATATVAMQLLSRYDLELGATVLRAAHSLGADRPDYLTPAVEYLCDQQRPDGSFGYFDVELAAAPADAARFGGRQQLAVPTTVSVLWTLKETTAPGSGNVLRDFADSSRAVSS